MKFPFQRKFGPGVVNCIPRPTTGVPSTAVRYGGAAFTPDGYAYVEVDANTTGDYVSGGQRYTADGAAYVTSQTKVASDVVENGIRYTVDGRMYVAYTTPTAIETRLAGVAKSSDGDVYISIAPSSFPEVLDYWDARYGIAQATATERVSGWTPTLKGSDVLVQGTAANQPILLPYAGTNYLWLPGVMGNSATTPDAAANTIAGDIGVAVWCASNDWTPAAAGRLCQKDDGVGDVAWNLRVNTDGTLRFEVDTSGAGIQSGNSTVATGFTDFAAGWVGVTRKQSTGDMKFYTSPDGVTWTQLGATVTAVGSGTLMPSADPVSVGNRDARNIEKFIGKIYRMKLFNAETLTGTPVLDMNFTAVPEGATTFTESSSNAATVTINSTGAKPAYIVGSQIIAGDAAAYFLQSTFTLNAPYFVVEVAMKPTWASGQVSWDGKTANSFALQDITASPQQRLHDGSANGATKSPTLSTWYVKAATQDASGNATFQLNLNAPTADTLSHTAMAGFTAFADGSGANFASGMKKAIAVGNVGISQARLNQLIRAMAWQNNVSV